MDLESLHSLLKRQLKRHESCLNLNDPKCQEFINEISEAYRQFDSDRTMLERSLDLSSQELVQANKEMRAIVRMLPDVFLRITAAGVILDCNESGESRLFRPASELIGKRIQEALAADVGELFDRAIRDVTASMSRVVVQFATQAGGAQRYCEASLLPLMDSQIVVFIHDITGRKRSEVEMARLVTAIEQAAESIMITDDKGTILYINPAFEHITGYTRDEVVGRNPRILRSGQQDHVYYRHMWDLLEHGHVWSGRLVDRRKDGSLFEWDSTISPVRDGDGKIVNYVAVSRDVSHEVQLEEQLRQSHKMEAIGRLAGGVAHDFNNLLTVIMGNIDLILPELAESDPHKQAINEIREAAQRAAALTGQLLAFGRRQVLHPKILGLNAVVSQMENMFRRLIGENILLQIFLAPDLGKVRADPTQMEQVILNLALNARDAMPQGGKLTITTSGAAIDDTHALRLGDIGPGVYVSLEISDTGVGMDAETRQHLFEPFYTTKERGKGTGLGLATVYGIVKQSGGHVSVYSEPGGGSTFRVYLPRVEDLNELPQPPRLPVGLVQGKETVLVVEDEDLVRKLACAMLQKHGYKILAARHGDEAVRLARAYEGPIDIMLSDVVMPGMKVEELSERMLEDRPGIKILYMSGHPESTIIHLGVFAGGMPLLKKPFTAQELAIKIREMLDAP